MNNPETNKNLNMVINHHTFTVSLMEIINLILDKINSKKLNELNKSYVKLQESCELLRDGFKADDFDQGKIIKKVFKTLCKYTEYLVEQNTKLFYEKNEENKIITSIPGVNIGLIVPHLDPQELTHLWGHIYMIFVSSAKMILSINKHDKMELTIKTVKILQEKITLMGLTTGKDKKTFNPYIGFTDDITTSTDLIQLGHDVETPSEITNENFTELLMGKLGSSQLAGLGLDKLVDLNKLNTQLQDIKQSDIDDATTNIATMLGASDDADVKDICGELVNNIVSDLKKNGIKNIFDTAKSVSSSLGNKLDRNKMKKTAQHLGNFMKNSEANLKTMKDDNGNPIINDNLMQTITNSLKMFQSMEPNN